MGEQAEFNGIAVGPPYWAGDIVDHPTSIHPGSGRSDLEEPSVLFHLQAPSLPLQKP